MIKFIVRDGVQEEEKTKEFESTFGSSYRDQFPSFGSLVKCSLAGNPRKDPLISGGLSVQTRAAK